MKIRYQEVEINMERMQCKTRKIIPAWETPVAQSVHPASEVIRDVVVDVPTPSVSEEYARMSSAYGDGKQEDGSIGDPYVESVYGKGIIGQQQLKIAMQASVLPKATPVTVIEPPPKIRKDLLQAVSGDDKLVEEPTEGAGSDADLVGEIAERVTEFAGG
jgi:hypothetical protein